MELFKASKINIIRLFILLCFLTVLHSVSLGQKTAFSYTKGEIQVNDFIEFSFHLKDPPKRFNPFTDVEIIGDFYSEKRQHKRIYGFCDSQDGKTFRLRFMPEIKSTYSFKIQIKFNNTYEEFEGKFTAIDSHIKSIVDVSEEYPTHFKYRNSDLYYFWNGTTAYWLSGWKDINIINGALERLSGYGINRVRVAINGRSHGGERWYEPNVVESENFTFKLNPWIARHPESLDNPEFDVSRMNVAHWQVIDQIMQKARSLNIVISLIFYVDGLDHACDPFKLENMGNDFEKLYYQYAINRFSSYPNLMWDIANEYHLFRTPEWAESMGRFVKQQDPYNHLISVHGSGDFPFRKSEWADVVMFQSWDECGGYDFIVNALNDQLELGIPKPIVNEEYGYEGHYPPWGCGPNASKERPDGRSALNRAMLAWEIYMAGGYQTTGETAEYGTGTGENTGGGWINGRGNEKMTMLSYYRIIKNIFGKTRFFKLKPAHHLTNYGNYCLANEGNEYLLYARNQHCRVALPGNSRFTLLEIDPVTGNEKNHGSISSGVDNNAWQYRNHLSKPTVFILKKIEDEN